MNRLVIVPEESHEALGVELKGRLATAAREIDAESLASVLNSQTLALLGHLSSALPGKILVWARLGNGYAVAWATDDKLRLRALADAGEGMIARVFESGRSETSTAANLELGEWSNLSQLSEDPVAEMATAPLNVFGTCAAAVSISLASSGETGLRPPAESAALLARLIEDRLLRMALGLETA